MNYFLKKFWTRIHAQSLVAWLVLVPWSWPLIALILQGTVWCCRVDDDANRISTLPTCLWLKFCDRESCYNLHHDHLLQVFQGWHGCADEWLKKKKRLCLGKRLREKLVYQQAPRADYEQFVYVYVGKAPTGRLWAVCECIRWERTNTDSSWRAFQGEARPQMWLIVTLETVTAVFQPIQKKCHSSVLAHSENYYMW